MVKKCKCMKLTPVKYKVSKNDSGQGRIYESIISAEEEILIKPNGIGEG